MSVLLGNIIKGVTHCLLPGCSKHVWPFMNYCSKTHAKAGMAQGLLRKLGWMINLG